jgi:fluoroacetyl-CoA thioesterase
MNRVIHKLLYKSFVEVSDTFYHPTIRCCLYSIFYDNIHLTAKKGICNMALIPGLTGEATTIVVHENTAASVGAGGVEVFGTPMMIALMENAAWRAVANSLDEGDVTVGTVVNVRHLAATPLGQEVRATAELIEIDGRRLIFNVEAYDEKRKIGEGQHERFIVNLERFIQRID